MNTKSLRIVCALILGLCSTHSTWTGSGPDHSVFTDVLKDHVVEGAVDYPAVKKDARFREYLSSLTRVDPYSIEDEKERLAFWINLYNAFTIKLIIDHYPVESIRDIKRGDTGPWDIIWVKVGGKKYSLNQVEHEVIRKEFNEPRIHMALVCAAVSCPPLRSEAYVGARLEEQLEDNTQQFLLDSSKNRYDSKTNTLYISEVFKWFADDFVRTYGSAPAFVAKVLGINPAKAPAVEYIPYDWSLNTKK